MCVYMHVREFTVTVPNTVCHYMVPTTSTSVDLLSDHLCSCTRCPDITCDWLYCYYCDTYVDSDTIPFTGPVDPLHYAASGGQMSVLPLLREAGARIDAKTKVS